jgi:ribosomal protein L7/L12
MGGVYSQQQLELKFGAINQRLSAIENQLKVLSDNASVPYEEPLAEIPEDVVELVRAGKGLEAAKRYRELTGVDGKEAMKVVGSI